MIILPELRGAGNIDMPFWVYARGALMWKRFPDQREAISLAIDNFPEGNNEQREVVQAFSARTAPLSLRVKRYLHRSNIW